MSFRDNLQHLRATRSMTQEQLAMMVGVSRQSVTKWEAERAYPEMDKLLKLCQIFDCTLDELVQGDLTTRDEEPSLSVPAESAVVDVTGYDAHCRSFAWHIAVGVALIIAGSAGAALADEVTSEGVAVLSVLAGTALGLLLIIPAVFERSAFKRAHPYVVDFYDAEQSVAEKRRFGMLLAGGIGLILAGVGFEAMCEGMLGADSIMLLAIAAGVGVIVYGVLMDDRLDVESYNIDALEDLSEETIASIVGEDRAAETLRKVRLSRRRGAACGIIMLVATAIALPLLFWATSTNAGFWAEFFWIPWMLGGFACAVACIVIGERG